MFDPFIVNVAKVSCCGSKNVWFSSDSIQANQMMVSVELRAVLSYAVFVLPFVRVSIALLELAF